MARVIINESNLENIADAIRAKNGSSDTYTPSQMASAITALSSEDYIQHLEIPSYVKESVADIVDKVRTVQNGANTFTFIAGSDAHQWDNANVTSGNLHAGMAMKSLAYALDLDCAMYLGDYTTGSSVTTIEGGLGHISTINKDIDEAFKGLPQFRTTGNHDPLTYSYSQNNDYLSEEELFPLIGAYCEGATYGSTTAGYCYRDFASKKIRVICLNTADITAATSGTAEAVSEAQRLWFADTLLSAGDLGSDWGIIVVSHHPLDWGDILIMSNIVRAYVTGSSVTVISGHSYNFSGHNSAKFICQFHGHVHCYKMDKLHYTTSGTEYDAYRMAIPNMCFNRNNEYGTTPSHYGIIFGEATTYSKTANSAEDTAFCVICIDLDAEEIYAFHYGAGYDRTLKYGAAAIYSITNTLTHVSTSNQSTSVAEGDSYTATISATAPYSVGSITVTMGGVDITSTAVSGNVISIASVTGNIVITASGVLGNLIDYFGYTDGKRISQTSGAYKDEARSTTIEYIDLSEFVENGQIVLHITGAQFEHFESPWDNCAYVFYNANKTVNAGGYTTGTTTFGNITVTVTSTGSEDTTITITGLIQAYVTGNYHYMRLCGVGSGANVDIRVGSDENPVLRKQINFVDYDGTILHSYTSTEWANISALPSNPSHTGLTAQGWNWTKAQIDAQLTAVPNGDVWVGQMYITDDGKTRIYIRLEDGRLHPYLGICPNGTVVVDWGDGSATSTLTGTSLTTVQHADHGYASGGDYVITLTVSSGSFAFFGVSNTSHILKKDTSTTANIHKVYTNAVQKVELGQGAKIGNRAFNCCQSLASITIPSGITSVGINAFQNCSSLTSIVIPSGTTSIGSTSFFNCYSLARVTIPSGITDIGDNTFNSCYSLASIMIPKDVTSIGTYAFFNCYSLARVTIPSEVTNIKNNAFNSCYGVAEYHIKPTIPPTLGTTVFNNIQSDCVIYVPSASLTTYQGASNWSAYASYMQGE